MVKETNALLSTDEVADKDEGARSSGTAKRACGSVAFAVVVLGASMWFLSYLLPILLTSGSGNAMRMLGTSGSGNAMRMLPTYIVPQNPGLGPNGLSTMHGNSWLSDTTNYPAPLHSSKTVLHQLKTQGQCYTTSFNSDGSRVIMLCHTIPVLDCLNPKICSKKTGTTLILASRSLNTSCWSDPDCDPIKILDLIPLLGKGRAAGIYFYVDADDVAVVANNQILEWYDCGPSSEKLTKVHSVDLSGYMVNDRDMITSAFPSWQQLIWWESNAGAVGTYDRASGKVGYWWPSGVKEDEGCPGVNCVSGIVKGFSIDSKGVYVLTNSKVIKFKSDIAPGTKPPILWNYTYDRGAARWTCTAPGCAEAKGTKTGMQSGMQSWGSGTSPKLFGDNGDLLGIADNAWPQINAIVLNRTTGEVVCTSPMFGWGTSATTTSFVGYRNTFFAVNDWGMVPGIGVPGAPGFVRLDVIDGDKTCKTVWNNTVWQTNTGCLKLSTVTGLVYNNINKPNPKFHLTVKTLTSLFKKLKNLPVEKIAPFFGNNYVLAVNMSTGKKVYQYSLNNAKHQKAGLSVSELNGWTFFVSNQVGPAGELYVGTFNGMKTLYDTTFNGSQYK